MLHRIKRVLSTWDFLKARKLYARGQYDSALSLIDKAIQRSGSTILAPYLFKYLYLVRKGALADGLVIKGIIKDELDRRSEMNLADKNYIEYYMLRLLPDDYLKNVSEAKLVDPKELGLQKVDRYLIELYPYKDPKPSVQAVLSKK